MKAAIKEAVERLRLWCVDFRVGWDESSEWRFCRYIELLLSYQAHANLTGFDTPDGLVEGLIIDSLQILRAGELSSPLLDVGTGAGFPSVPIKIVHPEIEMILAEPRAKRYAFLRKVEHELGLTGLTIERRRIEEVELQSTPGTVVSKAFRSLHEWLALALSWKEYGANVGCFTTCREWSVRKDEVIGQGWRVAGSVQEGDRVYVILGKA